MTKSPATEAFAARIGIDWGDAKHDICLLPAGATAGERFVLTHSPEAIDEWVHALRQRFGTRPIAIALELNKGPLVYAAEVRRLRVVPGQSGDARTLSQSVYSLRRQG